MWDENSAGFLIVMAGFSLAMAGLRRSARKRFVVTSTVGTAVCLISATSFAFLTDQEQFIRYVCCGMAALSIAICVLAWSMHFDRLKEIRNRW
jgi:hypothetical protein